MKKKYYPFSARLTKRLKKLRVYGKAKAAYDSIETKSGKLIKGKENDLSSCFIFSQTDEGINFWWEIHLKVSA